MSHSVFFSYSKKDYKRAKRLAEAITAQGHLVFIDSDISLGRRWDEALEQELSNAYAVVAMWTPNSIQSRWVRLEARYALERQILCPVFGLPCRAPIEFSDIEAADLCRWSGQSNSEFELLIDRLNELRRRPLQPAWDPQSELFYLLGYKFRYGINVPQSDTIARFWIVKAASRGHAQAKSLLSDND